MRTRGMLDIDPAVSVTSLIDLWTINLDHCFGNILCSIAQHHDTLEVLISCFRMALAAWNHYIHPILGLAFKQSERISVLCAHHYGHNNLVERFPWPISVIPAAKKEFLNSIAVQQVYRWQVLHKSSPITPDLRATRPFPICFDHNKLRNDYITSRNWKIR